MRNLVHRQKVCRKKGRRTRGKMQKVEWTKGRMYKRQKKRQNVQKVEKKVEWTKGRKKGGMDKRKKKRWNGQKVEKRQNGQKAKKGRMDKNTQLFKERDQ